MCGCCNNHRAHVTDWFHHNTLSLLCLAPWRLKGDSIPLCFLFGSL